MTNFVLAMIFLGLLLSFPGLGIISGVNAFQIGFSINLWLGLFNMLPFGVFDGKKILNWNRNVWVAMVIFGVYFLFFF